MLSYIYRIGYKIKCGFKSIKWFIQRGMRGYSDSDVWNIDIWFCETMGKILKQFNEHNIGVNNRLWRKYNGDADKAFEEQKREYDKMVKLLEEMNMNFDYLDANAEKRIKSKNEFFKLFSENFYELWW